MAEVLGEFATSGLLNIVGGCCGTTAEHIAAIADAAKGVTPRPVPTIAAAMRLSGLEPVTITEDSLFVNVGERTNITGSARFRKLIKDGDYDTALSVAAQQVEAGAQVIDVNMDEGMIDGVAAMDRFLKLIASEPDISRVPVMVDSSKWEVIEAGLKCVQGKAIVNSISMKEGEETFIEHARLCRRYGAAAVVMAFDEDGQADNLERRTAVCERAYRILTEQVGFPAEDIIFDPNVFAVATGIEEHATYGRDFIEATRWIKENLPGALVSGGISNVSFSFRGNNPVREAIHAVFLYHAIAAGLDMGIVNAGALVVYDQVDPELRERIEDVVLNRRADAAERLLEIAERYNIAAGEVEEAAEEWRELPLARADHALAGEGHRRPRRGRHRGRSASEIADRRWTPDRGDRGSADGRHERRRRPLRRRQDVPAAGRQERAGHEEGGRLPHPVHRGGEGQGPRAGQAKDTNGTIVMATVKGDVHDIGKNIVGVVLQCNNYEVIDLGVMVPAQKILDTAREVERRRDRAVRPDHAEPRRDGQRRGRDAAPGLHHAAADRRRDHLARPHRGQGRPEVRRSGGLGEGRLALGAGHGRAPARRPARAKLMADVKADYDSLRARHAAKNDRPLATLEDARAARTPIEWTGLPAAAAAPAAPAGPRRLADHRPPGRDPARAGLPERRPRATSAATSTGSRSSTPGR